MRNKKCILIFTLIIALLLVLVANVQAANDNPLTIVTNNTNNTNTTNNANTANSVNTVNNTDTAAPIITTNNAATSDNTANTDLPQTGITENTAIFVFIAVCVVSAIYAFIRVRNYKNI